MVETGTGERSRRRSGRTRTDDPRRRSWMTLGDWPLMRKVVVVLALPVLLATTFGGLRVVEQLQDADDSARMASQVAVLRPAVSYAVAVGELATAPVGSRMTVAGLAQADRTLRDAMSRAELTGRQRAGLDALLSAGTALRSERATLSPTRLQARVADVGTHLIVLMEALPRGDSTGPALRALAGVVSGQDAVSGQWIILSAGSTDLGRANQDTAHAIGRESAAIDVISRQLPVQDPRTRRLRGLNEARRGMTAAPAKDWRASMGRSRSAYATLTDDLTGTVITEVSAQASTARADALRDGALILAALVLSLALALIVARRVVVPIREMRRSVLQIAHEGLPAAVEQIRAGEPVPAPRPVPVFTREETGQLARAVDDMHERALALATEQARLRAQVGDMFETLSRRSTSMVSQQLALIDSLERDEQDPARLQALFRLDHLATRMRRNGDSLLVLAGATARVGGARSLTLADTIRAAQSGVRDFQRVRLVAMPSRSVLPGATADLVHLLTELVDNALSYSPPATQVRVGGAPVEGGGVLIEIVDEGLGMHDQDLVAANERMASGGQVDPATAKRMGLFVVGRLAQRHGVRVQLRANAAGGLTASVLLPATLLVEPAPTADVRSAPTGTERTQQPRTGVAARQRPSRPARTPSRSAPGPAVHVRAHGTAGPGARRSSDR
ncbi:ATP-binding protein [Luteipulveratus sp. YIM 133132]|uniref:sensor histidine kinase n=1 Tax=Luteipulveratus flavus TaxID=3031728 RepID=UPI0023B022C3|nr:ATP-binding protein [Luteipulveratus sp. YIM 133132]MDE9364844.1 ATP-binding protein [Luteipulveratus sp. YIM 133132]